MGSQNPTSGDRSRTNWTSAMERYFIDLMLDQVHRGNRMGHTFNKQAWNDMLVMFNSNFGSPYDVNILKSRYTNLWKQFNDIKNLLDQNGFSWDNIRKMVIADRYAWNAYVKAHPDAQSYKNKALVNFNDLCLIYAHTKADGRYSLSSHDIDYDDDIQGMNLDVGMNSLVPASKARPKTDWKPAMDRFFLKLMLDQLKKGIKINTTVKKQAWKDMVTLFNTKFGSQYGTSFLKRRYKKLLKYYTDVRSILARTGFYWDEQQQMIVADDDIWNNYIKALPDARLYRKKPLLNYQDLNLIYGNAISNGLPPHLHQDEEREDHSFSGNGHSACFEDLDSEGQDLMIEGEDVQSHVNDECLRIDWTPSMDRYLIDIMLKQLQKVNKIDYSFDNQAWIDVLVLFNERFGLQHDKDLLRSRYKSLEKQYHDIHDLLDQRGFWWDETHQMVTAYDDVWDAYIKEHPDVESYRTSSNPNYNDLCLIYGISNSDERHNQSGQSLGCNGVAKYNNSSHRRTDWTPPMDRYFIDLMLEQVRNGSMVNHQFRKLAWMDMVAKFSAEFGSQHDKDVLKSRFLNLRKRFNDMKTLLDQSVFAWDEMQQMVTADDDVWDAYVKEHPDARSYRNRTLPNFNDLYVIYGHANILKRESSSSHSTRVLQVDVDIVAEEDDQSPTYIDPSRIHWTKSMDHYFINLMLEQVHKGNKTGFTFNEQAWAWMTVSFNTKFGLYCDKNVLKNQFLSLMEDYKDVTNLLNRNCFAGDEVQQTITAESDAWEAYIKEQPYPIACGDRIFDSYNDLSMIYGNEVPDGRSSSSGMEMEKMGIDLIIGDLQSPAMEYEIPDQQKKRKPAASSTSASKRVQKIIKEEIQETLDEEPHLVKGLVSNGEDKDYCSIERIVAALETVPDMNDELFLEACQILEDDRKAKMFVAMDVTARGKWLFRKLRR